MLRMKRMAAAATVFEVIVSLGLLAFFMFFPIAVNSMTVKRNLLEDVKTIALQDASREGCVNQSVLDNAKLNLQANGFDPSQAKLDSNAMASNPIYMPDTTPITVSLYYPADTEVNFMNGLSRLLWASPTQVPFNTPSGSKWFYKFSGVILSEKAQY